jgi:aconitate hydratase
MGATLKPRGAVTVRVTCSDGSVQDITATVRIDTPEELVAFRNGGILPYVVRQLVKG